MHPRLARSRKGQTVSLDDVVQRLAARLDRGLIVLDSDFALVTHSAHHDVDRSQLAMILSRRGTPGAVAMITRYEVHRSTSPVRLPPDGDVPGHIVVPLDHDGTVTGYLSYTDEYGSSAPPREHLELLDEASSRLGALLAERRARRHDDDELAGQLVERLLSESGRERERAASELIRRGLLDEAVDHRTIAISAPASSKRAAIIAETLRALGESRRLGAVGVTGTSSLFITTTADLDPDALREIVESALAGRALAGVGGARTRLADIHGSWREATLALRAAERDERRYGHVASWELMGADSIVMRLPLTELTIDDLPSAVRQLVSMNDDEPLARTAESYAEHGGNASAAARELFIHRSTLYYRLGRIRALTGCDLSEPRACHELYLGLRVARLSGLWAPAPPQAERAAREAILRKEPAGQRGRVLSERATRSDANASRSARPRARRPRTAS